MVDCITESPDDHLAEPQDRSGHWKHSFSSAIRTIAAGGALGFLSLIGAVSVKPPSLLALFLQASPSLDPIKADRSPAEYRRKNLVGCRTKNIVALNDSEQDKAPQLRSSALTLIRKATRSDLATALKQLQESARLYSVRRHKVEAATDYLAIGDIYLTWGENRKALAAFRNAFFLSRPTDTRVRCSIWSRMALAYAVFGYLDQARRSASHAALIAERIPDEEAKGEALLATGAWTFYARSPAEALELFHSSAAIFKRTGDLDKQAAATRWVGLALSSLGLVKDALHSHTEASALWMENENPYGMAQANASLGMLWLVLGEPDKALTLYREAERTFRLIGDREELGIVLNGLGLVGQQLGDSDEALQYFTRAWQTFAAIGDKMGEVGSITSAAHIQWELHRYREARKLQAIGLKMAHQLHDHRFEASALSDLGTIYEHEHKYRWAQKYYARSIALCRSIHHIFGEASTLIRLGRLYAGRGYYSQALQSFQQALHLVGTTEYVAEEAQAEYEMANVYRLAQNLDNAATEAGKAIHIIETERTKVSDFDSRATYFASVHEYYQLYIQILMQLHKQSPEQDFAVRAFEASEKSKVRALLDMVGRPDSSMTCLDSDKSETRDIPASQEGSCASAAALTFRQVQAEVGRDDVLLLEYALGPDSSQLWAMDGGQLFSYMLPGEAEISKVATAYSHTLIARQLLANGDATRYIERIRKADAELPVVSLRLSEMLLGPVAHLLRRKRIIVVPDGALQYIPFAALPVPFSKGTDQNRPLAAEHEVVSLPSASILHALREATARRVQPARQAAVFADPVFSRDDPRISGHSSAKDDMHANSPVLGIVLRDIGFGSAEIPRLPSSRIEADTVVEAFSGKNVLLALDFDASRSTALTSNLGQYRYLHFATHGFMDGMHPEFSGLVLSLINHDGQPEDGYLRLRDIQGLHLAADLVVLSACNSALGKDLKSEGIVGLPRAFLDAGASRVISTLWKVDDEASAEMMKYFYSGLHDGKSPATALREAQMALAGNPHWQYPYFWAAFFLQGEYR